MKQHLLMSVAAVFFIAGCVTGPSKEDIEKERGLLDSWRDCSKSETVTLMKIEYDCTFADCSVYLCTGKVCPGEDETRQILNIEEINMSTTQCEVVFKGAE